MKITLISLYPDILAVGVRSLCASLKNKGHDASIIFLRNEFDRFYKDAALDEACALMKDSELIGISLMTNFFHNAVQVTQKIKKSTKAPVVWGGIHPTIMPEECLEHSDMVCLGEGEESLVELAGKIERAEDIRNVQGIWFKRGGEIIKTPLRPLIADLGSIPYPDCDYESQYALNDDGHISRLNEKLLKQYMFTGTYKFAGTYMTLPTRGCPFGCSYCCNNTLNKMFLANAAIRKRSIDNVVKELEEVKARMPYVDCIWFEDDSFFDYSLDEIKDFCVQYKNRVGLALEIHGISPVTINKEKLSCLVDAGLKVVRMGIQTANGPTKKLYKRNYPNHMIEKAVVLINGFKDKLKMIFYDIIIDNPWETDDQLAETLMFLSTLPPPYSLNIFSLAFYPGTELYDAAVKDGIIKGDLKELYRQSYHSHKKTYLNRLFFLLHEYAKRGMRLKPSVMSVLTRPSVRGSAPGWILMALVTIPVIISRAAYLARASFNAVRTGDVARISRYFKNKLK